MASYDDLAHPLHKMIVPQSQKAGDIISADHIRRHEVAPFSSKMSVRHPQRLHAEGTLLTQPVGAW